MIEKLFIHSEFSLKYHIYCIYLTMRAARAYIDEMAVVVFVVIVGKKKTPK